MNGSAPATVKLGLMPPMTGLVGIYGNEILNAARIACDEVNEAGGVLGRPLELVVEDDGSLPESAVAAAEKLVSLHRCVAIIGNLLSNSRIAVAYRVAEPHKIPYLNFSFYEGSILSHYFFHFAALPNQQIDRMIPYMLEKFGPRMFFAGNNYEWPRGSVDAAKRALLQAGGQVLGEEYTAIGVAIPDIDRLLDKVEAARPDVFVPYFAGIDQVNLLTRFTERGMKSRMAVVMGHYDELMASKLPAEVREGFYSSNTYFMTLDTPENRDYLARLARLPGITGIWPHGNGILTNFGEGTYLCVKAFAQAANTANSLESEALINALSTIRVTGPQGTVQMEPTTQHAAVNTYLSRCNADGIFEIVEKFGTISPIMPDRYRHQRVDNRATLEEDMRLQSRMLEQMSEAVMLVDTGSGTIIYANGGAYRMFGYERGEMIGLPIARLNSPYVANQEQVAAEITDIITRTGSWKGNIQNIRKDGTTLWSAATVNAFTHPVHGEVWMSVHQDITALKASEEKLQQSEERLRQVIEATNDGIWDWNVETGEDYLSPHWKSIFGYRDDELENKESAFFDMIHPGDRSTVTEAVKRHFEHKEPYRLEIRMRHKDGSYRWILTRGEALRDTSGRPVRMVGTIQDITERKQAEAEYKTIIGTSQDGFWLVSAKDGRFLDANPAAAQMLGYTREEMLKLAIPDIEAEQTPEDVAQNIQRIKESPEPRTRFETRHRCRDGRIINVEISTQYLEARGGVFVVFIRDITEHKQAEINLIEAKNQAEAANRAKSEFLANMSHEIRTPMNAILGLTRLVLDSELQPQQANYLNKVITSSRGLLGIINDILDYSKIEAGHMKIEHVPLRVEEILRDTTDLFNARIEEKELEIFLGISPDVPTELLGDPLRLAQVLNNLVGNAVKFTDHGEINIVVTAEPAGDDLILHFTVRDTGIGFDEQLAKSLFQPFIQADSSVTRKYGGTGLGLSICKKLVMLMGGEISVSSVAGKGSTFHFSIRASRSPTTITAPDLQQLTGLKVLVVDDQETSRVILRQLLEAWQLEVQTTASGIEALACIREAAQADHPFDIVLLDWRMPGMSGLEVARQIEQEVIAGSISPLLIVMVTMHDREALLKEADSLQLNGVLTKPVVPSQLLDILVNRRNLPEYGFATEAAAGAVIRFDGARILLVEDNPLNQEVASAFLERRGATVTLANNGVEAVERVQEQIFDAVLMDLHMPGMDGIEATRRIRALPEAQDLPIIAMTAAVLQEDRDRCIAVGMVDFIAKPVDPEALSRCLQKWLHSYARQTTVGATVQGASDLPELPGFDLAAALRRLDGDLPRLTRLLRSFSEERRDTLSQLDALLQVQAAGDATDLLHGLRGAAANLGATDLAAAAQQLEQELRAGEAPHSRAAFASALKAALSAIADAFPKPVTEPNALTEPDLDALAELLKTLVPYLQGGELIPDKLMQSLHQSALRDLPDHPLTKLIRKIDHFDHDGALSDALKLATRLNLERN